MNASRTKYFLDKENPILFILSENNYWHVLYSKNPNESSANNVRYAKIYLSSMKYFAYLPQEFFYHYHQALGAKLYTPLNFIMSHTLGNTFTFLSNIINNVQFLHTITLPDHYIIHDNPNDDDIIMPLQSFKGYCLVKENENNSSITLYWHEECPRRKLDYLARPETVTCAINETLDYKASVPKSSYLTQYTIPFSVFKRDSASKKYTEISTNNVLYIDLLNPHVCSISQEFHDTYLVSPQHPHKYKTYYSSMYNKCNPLKNSPDDYKTYDPKMGGDVLISLKGKFPKDKHLIYEYLPVAANFDIMITSNRYSSIGIGFLKHSSFHLSGSLSGSCKSTLEKTIDVPEDKTPTVNSSAHYPKPQENTAEKPKIETPTLNSSAHYPKPQENTAEKPKIETPIVNPSQTYIKSPQENVTEKPQVYDRNTTVNSYAHYPKPPENTAGKAKVEDKRHIVNPSQPYIKPQEKVSGKPQIDVKPTTINASTHLQHTPKNVTEKPPIDARTTIVNPSQPSHKLPEHTAAKQSEKSTKQVIAREDTIQTPGIRSDIYYRNIMQDGVIEELSFKAILTMQKATGIQGIEEAYIRD